MPATRQRITGSQRFAPSTSSNRRHGTTPGQPVPGRCCMGSAWDVTRDGADRACPADHPTVAGTVMSDGGSNRPGGSGNSSGMPQCRLRATKPENTTGGRTAMINRAFLTLCVLGGLTPGRADVIRVCGGSARQQSERDPCERRGVRSVSQPRGPMQPGGPGRRSHDWRDENLRGRNSRYKHADR